MVAPDCVLHVAMEYSIPHLGYNDQFIYGGLGKVVDAFLRCWEGNIALCCPLYRGKPLPGTRTLRCAAALLPGAACWPAASPLPGLRWNAA